MFVNRKEVKVCMIRKGITTKEISEKMGITVQAFYQKMAGVRPLREEEIKILWDVFRDKNIFFLGSCVQNRNNKSV